MKASVTLKDVALRAGVSYQTVSKVLRNQIHVSSETRARVEAAVAELEYHPNSAARSLRTQSTFLFGYSFKPALHNEPNPILEGFLQSIVRQAEAYDYHIMLFPWDSKENIARAYQELILKNRVDGFILSDVDFDDPRIPLLVEQEFPFVAFGLSNSNPTYAYVDVNGRRGIQLVVRHFIENGHRNIAVLAWPESSRTGESRLNGYYDAMQEAELPVMEEWVRRGHGTLGSAVENTQHLLDLPDPLRPTAIVTMMDMMALGAFQAIQERGLRVGQDIAVSGFDDTSISRWVRPSLTTLRQPIEQVGITAIELLIQLLNGGIPEKRQFLLDPELIVRESSVPNHQGLQAHS
jgi:DNA-binding LacI/PurR family transcriptional regulator